jgi:GrpB-like predicted nucleotidyltransferase (UPF0157 family)
VEAWRRLRTIEGPGATVIDLYELVAHGRGLTAPDLTTAERRTLAHSVMPDIWPQFEVTAESSVAAEVVTIADYDDGWPERYARWRDVLSRALGPTAVRIEHVGSTAVPGLAAKPIVDVQVSVRDMADEAAYVPQLRDVGLELRSRDALHRYFRPFPGMAREVHVHVCDVGSDWEADHLLFRDHLRTHGDARARYARAKRDAAARWSDDRLAYTDAKTGIILRILDEARAEAG